MAAIDLKNAYIRFKDGYAQAGAVNLMAGYAVGLSTMVVDGITGIIATGTVFTIAAHTTEYTVSAHTETLGNTTSITFTPPLVAMAADDEVIHFGPHRLTVKIGQGNLTYDESRNINYVLDRGLLDTVKQGDEVPMDVKLDFTWEFLKADTGEAITVEDALKHRGLAVDWITASADVCEPYALDVEVEYVPPCGGTKREIITLPDFRYEKLAHDLKAATVSMTGKCNATEAIVVRAA